MILIIDIFLLIVSTNMITKYSKRGFKHVWKAKGFAIFVFFVFCIGLVREFLVKPFLSYLIYWDVIDEQSCQDDYAFRDYYAFLKTSECFEPFISSIALALTLYFAAWSEKIERGRNNDYEEDSDICDVNSDSLASFKGKDFKKINSSQKTRSMSFDSKTRNEQLKSFL